MSIVIRRRSASYSHALGTALIFGAFAIGCSSSSGGGTTPDGGGSGGESGSSGSPGSGGTHNSGGTPGSGGSHSGGSPGTGGAPGSGGAGTGGVPGTGGTPGTGGAPATGGAPSSGGSGGVPEAGLDGGDAGDGATCPSLGALVPPTGLDASLIPPGDTRLTQRFRGVGSQVYTCTGTPVPTDAGDAGVTYAWSAAVPDAKLLDDDCKEVGKHFLGPTWQSNVDHSSVKGQRIGAKTVDATAIPWLLLKSVANTGGGIFSGVSFIQRVDTVGGLGPTKACGAANSGEVVRSPYTATYYFYESLFGTDGGHDAGHD